MTTSAPDERAPAVFLDRDGTIMRDVEYCGDPARVEIFPDAAAALCRLKNIGFKIIVITNQSGIGRGYFAEEAYRAVEAEVARQLGADVIDATYFCPDPPNGGGGSVRRKPSPAMVFEAERDLRLDLSRSFFVGDKRIDAECGRNSGVRTILVQTGCEVHAQDAMADWVARDLPGAVEIILRHGI